MSLRRIVVEASIMAALLVVTTSVQSLPAQTISGKQQQADEIPSTRQALAGRLFFSHEQRERMDRARTGGEVVVEQDVIDPPASGINGFVKRSDGETVVWVDGKARYNVVGENAARLQPQDVGGAPDEIHILAESGRATGVIAARRPVRQIRIPHKKKPVSAQQNRPTLR